MYVWVVKAHCCWSECTDVVGVFDEADMAEDYAERLTKEKYALSSNAPPASITVEIFVLNHEEQ